MSSTDDLYTVWRFSPSVLAALPGVRVNSLSPYLECRAGFRLLALGMAVLVSVGGECDGCETGCGSFSGSLAFTDPFDSIAAVEGSLDIDATVVASGSVECSCDAGVRGSLYDSFENSSACGSGGFPASGPEYSSIGCSNDLSAGRSTGSLDDGSTDASTRGSKDLFSVTGSSYGDMGRPWITRLKCSITGCFMDSSSISLENASSADLEDSAPGGFMKSCTSIV